MLEFWGGSNYQFIKLIGQSIPDTWRSGVHFHNVEVNTFSPGEAVVVTRSNGTKTFGVVEKCNAAVCANIFLALHLEWLKHV